MQQRLNSSENSLLFSSWRFPELTQLSGASERLQGCDVSEICRLESVALGALNAPLRRSRTSEARLWAVFYQLSVPSRDVPLLSCTLWRCCWPEDTTGDAATEPVCSENMSDVVTRLRQGSCASEPS